MAQKIKIRRGLKKDLPLLEVSELGFCTDTTELYIGTPSGNALLGGNSTDKTTVTKGSNGTINVDGVEIKVFDDQQIKSLIDSKVDIAALNYKADVTDLDKAISAVNANLFGKVNKTEVESLLANKVEKSYVDNAIANVQTIKGDKGEMGLQGERGLQGVQGLKGDTGTQGLQGLRGDKGDTGERGLQGLKGEQGEKGADGTGVAILGSFTNTSLLPSTGNVRGDAYLINGDMQVWSGTKWDNVGRIKGDTGEKGEPGATTYTWIKYATSSSGDNISDSPDGKTYMGIATNKTSATKSTNSSDYVWAQFKGDNGTIGGGMSDIKIEPYNGELIVKTIIGRPRNIIALFTTETVIKVGWDYHSDAKSYNVYIDNVLAGNTTENTFTKTGLAKNTAYQISLESVSKDIVSIKSSATLSTLGAKVLSLSGNKSDKVVLPQVECFGIELFVHITPKQGWTNVIISSPQGYGATTQFDGIRFARTGFGYHYADGVLFPSHDVAAFPQNIRQTLLYKADAEFRTDFTLLTDVTVAKLYRVRVIGKNEVNQLVPIADYDFTNIPTVTNSVPDLLGNFGNATVTGTFVDNAL